MAARDDILGAQRLSNCTRGLCLAPPVVVFVVVSKEPYLPQKRTRKNDCNDSVYSWSQKENRGRFAAIGEIESRYAIQQYRSCA